MMFKRPAFLALTLFVLTVALPQAVYPEFFSEEFGAATKQQDLILGATKVISVSNPKKVAVGDPKVADIINVNNFEILIAGKAVGETNLQIWDDFGQREIVLKIFAEDLSKLKKRLEDLFGTAGLRGITFQVGEEERKIFCLGDLPLRKQDVVKQLLGNFTDKIINLITYSEDNPLVEVDVQIVEIAKSAVDKLGIDWSSSLTFTELPAGAGSAALTALPHTLSRQFGDLLKSVGQSRFDRTQLIATMNILEQDNLARILARPKLVALSGKEAAFLVGGQIPVISSVSVASGTTTTSVEYKDIGVKLSIKPTVKETGDVQCQLKVEIIAIDKVNALAISTGGAVSTSTPAFKTRSASTELYLKPEQTIFMAGLIDNELTKNLRQVPGFGDLPIIGALFRSKDFEVGDTELVISITPRILNYGDMSKDIQNASIVKKGSEEEPADAYVRTIQETILKSVSYPLEAQRANLSGSVVVSLHLLSNGTLVNAVVDQSCGHKLLDSAAMYTVKRLAPYPPFPKGLTLKEIWVEVPITYQST